MRQRLIEFRFLSTLSLRRATISVFWMAPNRLLFLSTLSLRRATACITTTTTCTVSFLSTLSLRRATCYSLRHSAPRWHFYPRSPCGERPVSVRNTNLHPGFLSTLSLRRATVQVGGDVRQVDRFLSTLSLRRATGLGVGLYLMTEISIHALLAESDSQQPRGTTRTTYFYPRSPCGERQVNFLDNICHICISIHALLAESDKQPQSLTSDGKRFLSTLSLRRATI